MAELQESGGTVLQLAHRGTDAGLAKEAYPWGLARRSVSLASRRRASSSPLLGLPSSSRAECCFSSRGAENSLASSAASRAQAGRDPHHQAEPQRRHPARHLVEVRFDVPADFPDGTGANVPGLIMKPTEQARRPAGRRLGQDRHRLLLDRAGNAAADKSRNVTLMRNRDWIDNLILYGRRSAPSSPSKMGHGERVVDALAAWSAIETVRPRLPAERLLFSSRSAADDCFSGLVIGVPRATA